MANREVAPDRPPPAGPVLRLRLPPPGARPGPRGGWCARAIKTWRFPGDQGPPPRARITREICAAARAYSATRALRRHGRGSVVGAAGHGIPGGQLHHPPPGKLRRRLAGPARPDPTTSCGIPTFIPTPRACAGSTSWSRRGTERAGARKILFGSDGPWLHPGVELAKVHALGFPPGRKEGDRRQHPPPDQQRKTEAAVPSSHAVAARSPPRAEDPWQRFHDST